MHTPDMIADLAVMLLTAGVITIIFKKIKQPLVLGYILAGFLISPYFPLFFNVEDTESINLWSEIGVIVLMFHIGLEFNLHKLARMGGTPILVCIIEMSGVLTTGYLVGQLMGFSSMNSIFLGVMLSISSTAVIQKSFDEAGVKNEKYSQLVLANLIVEDIMAIFMMVILSTISVSKNVSGVALGVNLFLMICYLIVWLILGIFFLPTFLNKVIDVMNDEMVVILSLGTCFGMVLIANALGFSSELGAFLAGSLIAGTVHVERVERITKGIKDMFVAIFFLSVGMKVDPHIIVEYAPTIVIVACTVVTAKFTFATLGMLISGQSPRTALHGGFSLGPIGEFSFIIATLGITLEVMDKSLYPIIVSAAILTAFITPMLIRKSDDITDWILKHIPQKLVNNIYKYTSNEQIDDDKDTDWNDYIKRYFSHIAIYGVIMLVIVMAVCKGLYPGLKLMATPNVSKLICTALAYTSMAIFVRPMMDFHNSLFTALWLKRKSNRLPLIAFTVIKIVTITIIAMLPLHMLFKVTPFYLVIILFIAICITAKNGFMSTSYLKLETRFLRNLNERIIEREISNGGGQSWLDEELRIISFFAPSDADFLETSVKDLGWGHIFNVFIVKIRRNDKHIILPSRDAMIYAGDKVYIIGDLKSIENFYRLTKIIPSKTPRTLKEFMDSGYPIPEKAIAFCAVKLTGDEPYCNKSIKNSLIREKWHCLVLGIQQNGLPTIMPNINTEINADDIIWIMGSNNHVGRMIAESMVADNLDEEI